MRTSQKNVCLELFPLYFTMEQEAAKPQCAALLASVFQHQRPASVHGSEDMPSIGETQPGGVSIGIRSAKQLPRQPQKLAHFLTSSSPFLLLSVGQQEACCHFILYTAILLNAQAVPVAWSHRGPCVHCAPPVLSSTRTAVPTKGKHLQMHHCFLAQMH